MNIISDKIVTTRKKHNCNACGRVFDKGTKMRAQVNILDGIQTWRECQTCIELLSKFATHFADSDGICYMGCVSEGLNKDQTPEQLLNELQKS